MKPDDSKMQALKLLQAQGGEAPEAPEAPEVEIEVKQPSANSDDLIALIKQLLASSEAPAPVAAPEVEEPEAEVAIALPAAPAPKKKFNKRNFLHGFGEED